MFGTPRKKDDFYFFGQYYMKTLEFEWFGIAMGEIVIQKCNKNCVVCRWQCHFSFRKSQIVAPLTKIVALFEKKMWGAFRHEKGRFLILKC